RSVEAGEHRRERRLARAVLADERDDLAGADLELHRVQCEARRLRRRAVAGRRGGIAERDMLELDPAEWPRGLQRARCGGRSERGEGLTVLEAGAGLVG